MWGNNGYCTMRYYKTLGIFKTVKSSFDPNTMRAYSYNWWRFVDYIGGKVIFNDARYSMQTSAHQSAVKEVLRALRVKYHTVYIKAGLNHIDTEIADKRYEIKRLNNAISNPLSRRATNEKRKSQIKYLEKEIASLTKLLKAQQRSGPFKGKLDWNNYFKSLPKKTDEEIKAEKERRKEYYLKKKAERQAAIDELMVEINEAASQLYEYGHQPDINKLKVTLPKNKGDGTSPYPFVRCAQCEETFTLNERVRYRVKEACFLIKLSKAMKGDSNE